MKNKIVTLFALVFCMSTWAESVKEKTVQKGRLGQLTVEKMNALCRTYSASGSTQNCKSILDDHKKQVAQKFHFDDDTIAKHLNYVLPKVCVSSATAKLNVDTATYCDLYSIEAIVLFLDSDKYANCKRVGPMNTTPIILTQIAPEKRKEEKNLLPGGKVPGLSTYCAYTENGKTTQRRFHVISLAHATLIANYDKANAGQGSLASVPSQEVKPETTQAEEGVK